MDEPIARWDVPRYSRMLDRANLRTCLARVDAPVSCLVAPAGWGKSVLAAQVARACAGRHLWVALRNAHHPPEQVLARCMRLLTERSGSGSVEAIGLVVLDAFVFESEIDIEVLRALSHEAGRHGGRLLVVTRDIPRSLIDVLQADFILDASDLRLSDSESTSVVTGVADDISGRALPGIILAARGCPALLVALAREQLLRGESSLDIITPPSTPLTRTLVSMLEALRCPDELEVLSAAVLLREGELDDLDAVCGRDVRTHVHGVSEAFPLFVVDGNDRGAGFRVHPLGVKAVLGTCEGEPNQATGYRGWSAAALIRLQRGHAVDALTLATRFGSRKELAYWLERCGEDALIAGDVELVRRALGLVGATPLAVSPQLLLLSAQVRRSVGDSLGCREAAWAAFELSAHAGSRSLASRALAVVAESDFLGGHFSALCSGDLADVHSALLEPADARTVRRFTHAAVALATGGSGSLHVEPVGVDPSVQEIVASAHHMAYLEGDRHGARVLLAALRGTRDLDDCRASHIDADIVTLEMLCGRIPQARQVFEEMHRRERSRDAPTSARETVLRGWLELAAGTTSIRVDAFRDALAVAVPGLASHWSTWLGVLVLCPALRALGRVDEALVTAERALEWCSTRGFGHLQPLARIEYAACLLGMGDLGPASQQVADLLETPGRTPARVALRAAFVASEVACRREDRARALRVLVPWSQQLQDGGSSWEIAACVATWPGLSDVIADSCWQGEVPHDIARLVNLLRVEGVSSVTEGPLGDSSDAPSECGRGESEVAGADGPSDALPLCTVRMFGGFEVRVGQRVIGEREWRKRKARQLFAMLCCLRGREVSRERLMGCLWPEMSEDRARNNFYVIWSTMKSALMPKGMRRARLPYVDSRGLICRIAPALVRSDLDEFEELITAARRCAGLGRADQALEALGRLTMVYRDELLPGDPYEDWFATTREHYRAEFIDAMGMGARLARDSEDWGGSLRFTRRGIEADPLREDLYAEAMRTCLASDQRAAAVDLYFTCRRRLAEELGIDPSDTMSHLYELAIADRPGAPGDREIASTGFHDSGPP